MSRTLLVLALLLAACGNRRSGHAPRTSAPPAAPRPAPTPPVAIALACGHVHAELPSGARVTSYEPCLLPWNGVDHADGEGFVGGGSSLHVSLDGCSSDVYVEQTAPDEVVPETPLTRRGPEVSAPADISFNGPRSHVLVTAGVLNGGDPCGVTRDHVLQAIADSAHVDAPAAATHARFVVAEDGTTLALDVPDGYIVGYVGTEADQFATAWRVIPRERGAPDVSITTFHDRQEDGTRPRHPRVPMLESHRLFGRPAAWHAPTHDVSDEPGNGTRPEPCLATWTLVGPEALVMTVSVCGPDGPARDRLFDALGSATVTRP